MSKTGTSRVRAIPGLTRKRQLEAVFRNRPPGAVPSSPMGHASSNSYFSSQIVESAFPFYPSVSVGAIRCSTDEQAMASSGGGDALANQWLMAKISEKLNLMAEQLEDMRETPQAVRELRDKVGRLGQGTRGVDSSRRAACH